MEIEIFTVCDFSQDFQGKLVIVGTFDTLQARDLPTIHPVCSIAGRIRFEDIEAGPHQLKITILDPSSVNIVPPLEGQMQVQISPNMNSATANFVIIMNQLRFAATGRHTVNLFIDGAQRKSLPLFVNRAAT